MNVISYLESIFFLTFLSIAKSKPISTAVGMEISNNDERATTYLSSRLIFLRQPGSKLISEHNPKVLNVSNHMEQNAISNLDLRQHFLRENKKFNELFDRLHKTEKALAIAKKRLRDIHSAAKGRINLVKVDLRYGIREQKFEVHKLDTKYELTKKTNDENQSKVEDMITRVQQDATDSNIQGNDMVSKVSNLMQTFSQIIANPIAGAMDAINVLPLAVL